MSRRVREHHERQRVDDRSMSQVNRGVRDRRGVYLEQSTESEQLQIHKFSAGSDVNLPQKRNVSES